MSYTYLYMSELKQDINKIFKKKRGYLNKIMLSNFKDPGARVKLNLSTWNFVHIVFIYIGTKLGGKTEKNPIS